MIDIMIAHLVLLISTFAELVRHFKVSVRSLKIASKNLAGKVYLPRLRSASETEERHSSSVRVQVKYHVSPPEGTPCQTAAGNSRSGERARADHRAMTTVGDEWHDMDIHNISAEEAEKFDLDINGFTMRKADGLELADDEWLSEKAFQQEFLPRAAEVVKKLTGATDAIPSVAWSVRSADAPKHGGRLNAPACSVHVDSADGADGAEKLCNMDLIWAGKKKAEREQLLSGRYRMIQVWKPIKHATYDYPLACADWQTVDMEKDLFASTLLYPHGATGKIYQVRHNPAHKFYSISGQKPNEVLFFKGFDSESKDNVARFTAHTSFAHPAFAGRLKEASEEMGFEVKGRESCEARYWIFG